MVADELSLDDGLQVGDQLGDVQRVVEGVGLTLLQWAGLDVTASVRVDAGDGDLKTVDGGGELDLDLGGVLVGDKVGLQGKVVTLVDLAEVAAATGQVEGLDFVVGYWNQRSKINFLELWQIK